MQLSLCLSFYLRHNFRGYTVGTTVGFQVEIVEALAPQISPINPMEVLTVAYENLFDFSLKGHFFRSAQMEGTVSYPVLRKRERSLHTCAQDVQITRTVTT
jgi:hypothetical protein